MAIEVESGRVVCFTFRPMQDSLSRLVKAKRAEPSKPCGNGAPSLPNPGCTAMTPKERILNAFGCLAVDRRPIWLMRQAGRCLPEYRELRKKYSFRQLIQVPALAAEVTLQPIHRFGFDAAIMFSDILVVPEALGQGYRFRDNGGVVMDYALEDKDAIAQLESQKLTERLQYVAQAIKLVKGILSQQTALLGFAGSPWTLANFMLEGGSARKPLKALELFHRERGLFELLAEKLTLAVIEFLKMQVEAGVDAIQIFDSMGGLLPPEDFELGSGQWIYAITSALGGKLPVIVYSKGTRNWKALVRTGAQVIGLDHGVELAEANKQLPATMALQGNLNPELLRMARPAEVAQEATRLLEQMRGRDGYIFNLGHGVPPETRMENLEALAQTVRSFV